MEKNSAPRRDSECVDCVALFKGSITDDKNTYVIIILGASGDLAKKKTYPCLWWLFRDNLLPLNTFIIGYARSELDIAKIRAQAEPNMKLTCMSCKMLDQFWERNFYIQGDYSKSEGFQKLDRLICDKWGPEVNRIFYFAVPPSVYVPISSNIRSWCMAKSSNCWTRLIIEKPFGHDLKSSDALSDHLAERFSEDQIYRIDHYLGKEMIQSLMILRFANQLFTPLSSHEYIDNVTITFKEPFGTEGRGGYFDQFGIIRDVVQNHLMQILSLVAMERPDSLSSDDIRDKKVQALRQVKPLTLDNVVIGQYVADPSATEPPASLSYTDDPTVPNDSITPTYVCMVIYVNNERWKGVPFILRAGKALNEHKAEVRFQFKDIEGQLFPSAERNEMVIRVQPDEAVYVKLITKTPGMRFDTEETELDLTYSKRYQHIKLPDAYERLLLDVFCGSQANFVRCDELSEAWRILTPLLDQLEREKIKPIPYPYGSRDGPPEAFELRRKVGYRLSRTYKWPFPENKEKNGNGSGDKDS
ncbi:unnamed protein product [Calicophoron daubneyi]|uniref:Glucose-6-phosphate 1-dehydrogenase n=1 Tax=Calicophoron daubneyi TaxID=300641 RepID=A0AAV2TCU7_CALDB